MADELKDIQTIAQVEFEDASLQKVSQAIAQAEWADTPLLKLSQTMAQTEWTDPPLLKVHQLMVQLEYIRARGRINVVFCRLGPAANQITLVLDDYVLNGDELVMSYDSDGNIRSTNGRKLGTVENYSVVNMVP